MTTTYCGFMNLTLIKFINLKNFLKFSFELLMIISYCYSNQYSQIKNLIQILCFLFLKYLFLHTKFGIIVEVIFN